MSGGDKALAIFVTTVFVGVLGALIAGWPALIFAAIAVAAIAYAPGEAA